MYFQPKSSDLADLDIPSRPLRLRTWFRIGRVIVVLLAFGAIRLPVELRLNEEHRAAYFHGAKLNLSLQAQIGQLSSLAALGGLRGVIADGLWITAYFDWQHTEWGKMLLLFNTVTALQPRDIMFWEMSSWHMAYNASNYAMEEGVAPRLPNAKPGPTVPPEPMSLRLRHQHEDFIIGRDLLERGIANNPDKPDLYEAQGHLLMDKLHDHYGAYVRYGEAARFPTAMSYDQRFSSYELSHCPGYEWQAYNELLWLYNMGEKERLPTLLSRLKYLQEKLNIPAAQRIDIPDSILPPILRNPAADTPATINPMPSPKS